MSKINKDKNKNKQKTKKLTTDQFAELQHTRVIQKNLTHIIGISRKLCDKDLLSKKEYFGQYGKITKIYINTTNAYDPENKNGPSFSAFITYTYDYEAALAILCVEGFFLNGHVLRAAFGSNKYCNHFLKNTQCLSKDCMYIHSLANSKDVLNKKQKDNMLKSTFYEQNKNMAQDILDAVSPILKTRIFESKISIKHSIFPQISSIQNKIKKFKLPSKVMAKTYSNNTIIGIKADKMLIEEDRNYKTEEIIKELYLSDLSGISLSVSTDNLLSKEKKCNLFEKRDKSRFKFVNPKIEANNIPDFITAIISRKTKTYYFLRNVDLDEYNFYYTNENKIVNDWDNLSKLTEKSL